MLTILATAMIGSVHVDTIKNGETTTPAKTYDVIQKVATEVGVALYAPDKLAQGYTLRKIEMAKLPEHGAFPGLEKRVAVRMTFFNSATMHSFDLVQAKTSEGIDARRHMKWVSSGGFFEMGVLKGDTFVAKRVGGKDIGFHSSLVGDDSAREVLKRLKRVAP